MFRTKILHKTLLLALIWMTAANALDSDKSAPMHVISNSATYDRNQHIITYDGNVQGDQGSARLDGDKLVVFQNPDDTNESNKIKMLIVYGNPAHYSSLPAPDKGRIYVEAYKITYDPNNKTVLLEDHGRVTQDGNVFSGPHIWYDMVNGVVRSQAIPGKERSEMVIQPQQISPKK
jgi:lipopolysaccharide export system protein LptA